MGNLLAWDQAGERLYETGVDRGVLYIPDVNGDFIDGVVWNGLTSVSESPTGADTNPQYADNIKYLNLVAKEEFEATIEAFTYPDEFAQFDGSVELQPGMHIGQQNRTPFGLCYRSLIGDDLQGTDLGYKLHIVYNALAAPTEKSYETVNESPEAITFSWELTTTPVAVTGHNPTASVVVNSTKVDAADLAALETILYGDDDEAGGGVSPVDPRLPLPDEISTLLTPA